MTTYTASYQTKTADSAQPKTAYSRVQINEVREQHPVSNHIATHSNRYNRGDILPPAAAMTAVSTPGAVAKCTLMCSLIPGTLQDGGGDWFCS